MRTATDYEAMADCYLAAARRGDRPVQAVAATFGISYPLASKRIFEARRDGLLPATSPGAPSDLVPKRVLAVAEAIGIDPVVLRDAIREYGAGRVSA